MIVAENIDRNGINLNGSSKKMTSLMMREFLEQFLIKNLMKKEI